MQARHRNNSTSDNGWEEVSVPDEVRSVGSSSCFSDDEILILKGGVSPRPATMVSPQINTLEVFMSPPPSQYNSSTSLAKLEDATPISLMGTPHVSSEKLIAVEVDSVLSPIEKTLLHQITRLSEELEVSKMKNEVLEQTIHRDDLGMFQDEDNATFFRLGLKTLGFVVLLSVVQRKFIMSGLVSILGAAFVGGLLTYEQEASKRRRGE